MQRSEAGSYTGYTDHHGSLLDEAALPHHDLRILTIQDRPAGNIRQCKRSVEARGHQRPEGMTARMRRRLTILCPPVTRLPGP